MKWAPSAAYTIMTIWLAAVGEKLSKTQWLDLAKAELSEITGG